MNLTHKTILQSMLYYTLIGLVVVLSIIYMIALTPKDVMMYAKVIYWIWVDVLVLTVLFDIACTIMGKGKFLTGMILYVLAILCIAMGIIVYFDLSKGGVLAESNMYMFQRLVMSSGIISVLSILAYITGEFISSNTKGIK